MHYLVVLVLGKPELIRSVLEAWTDAGAAGATVLESTGMGRVSRLFGRDDVPLFPSLEDLDGRQELVHGTIFSVVDGEALMDKIIAATQTIVGDLSEPDRGILFATPLAKVVGYRPSQKPTT